MTADDRHEQLAQVIRRARKVQHLADTLLADDLPDTARRNTNAARNSAILAEMFLTDDREPMSDARFERGLGMIQQAESIAKTASLQITQPHAERGHKILRAASSGHESVHGTRDAKQKRWDELRRALAEKMQRNPALSLTEARKQIASDHGVSYSTMKRIGRQPQQ